MPFISCLSFVKHLDNNTWTSLFMSYGLWKAAQVWVSLSGLKTPFSCLHIVNQTTRVSILHIALSHIIFSNVMPCQYHRKPITNALSPFLAPKLNIVSWLSPLVSLLGSSHFVVLWGVSTLNLYSYIVIIRPLTYHIQSSFSWGFQFIGIDNHYVCE